MTAPATPTEAPTEAQAALIAHARAAAAHAYAPYSGFHVGAALLMADGAVITAANVENASYGLSLCAETVALAKAANEARLAQVRAIAIIGGRPEAASPPTLHGTAPVAPCGRCRQLLNEAAQLGGHDIAVTCASGDGRAVVTHPLSALLPLAFGPADLGLAPATNDALAPPTP